LEAWLDRLEEYEYFVYYYWSRGSDGMSGKEQINILVVDDEPFYLDLLVELLSSQYSPFVAENGLQALDQAKSNQLPMLILLDVVMPEMDGYEVCKRFKSDPTTHDIPIIFLTGKSGVEDEMRGLELGAVDYIAKPISPPILLSRVRNHLALAQQRIALEGLVTERTKQIEKAKDAVTFSMGALAEARDDETGFHLQRTRLYVKVIAENMSGLAKYSNKLTPKMIDLVVRAAPLHDIGKIGIPDNILRKAGRLTEEEKVTMSRHTLYGKQALEKAEKDIGHTPYLEVAKQIAYCHHERWDGSGYPEGLSGDKIPISARIMAIADVYDALISKRHYKDAMSHREAIALMEKSRGTHFDPAIFDIFLQVSDKFFDIAERFKDRDVDKIKNQHEK
jgi:putative two-component system response regulator